MFNTTFGTLPTPVYPFRCNGLSSNSKHVQYLLLYLLLLLSGDREAWFVPVVFSLFLAPEKGSLSLSFTLSIA